MIDSNIAIPTSAVAKSQRASSGVVIIKLSQSQAKIVWGVLDGAADAGSCKDGLTRTELDAINNAVNQILKQRNW